MKEKKLKERTNENGFKFEAYSRFTHFFFYFFKENVYIIVAKWIIIGLVYIRHERKKL